MHRWFFAIEREECEPKVEEVKDVESENVEETAVEMIHYTEWPFCVIVSGPLQGNELAAVTGNCEELGNWDPKHVVIMKRSPDPPRNDCVEHKFMATINIPRNHNVEYRYCIVGVDEMNNHIIRFWEVHPVPRIIATCHNLLKKCEYFGRQNPKSLDSKIDRGWATYESIVQFRIFNAPFIWQKQTPRLIYVHMQPMYEREPRVCAETRVTLQRLSDLTLLNMNRESMQKRQLAFAEVCNLLESTVLKFQAACGARCGPKDLEVYHCSVGSLESTLYRLDLYTYAHKAAADEPPYHYGYGLITPDQLSNTEGSVRVKITCASTHRPLIELNIKYLIIRPLDTVKFNMLKTYERYWTPAHKPLEIGHRGTGSTYILKDDIHRENTVYAFKQAQKYQADMIEMDVHLTKDAKVVVYHDFTLKFGLCSSTSIQKMVNTHDIFVFPYEKMSRIKLLAMGGVKRDGQLLVPIESFLYDELQLVNALLFTTPPGCEVNCEKLIAEQKPFPLLSDIFNEEVSGLTEKMGFNIEIKWPQQETNGRWQDNSFKPTFDRNFYVDTILELVFQLAGNRRIMFSSFDADICLMIRFKQNFYPVMLLINDYDKPLQFMDERVRYLENALHLAHSFEFLGMDIFSTILLRYPIMIGKIRELQVNIVTYGVPNNSEEVRNKLKRYGLMGITYDRIDQEDQAGETMQGNVCFIDTMATRLFISLLQETEKLNKCMKKK